MFDREKLDAEGKQYFDSLSPLMQETLIQSGVSCRTKEELMRFSQEQNRK